IGAFIGHLYPVWLGFRGGKGVATYIGVLLALAWQGALVFAIAWIAVAALLRYSSLAALSAAIAVPIGLLLLDIPLLAGVFALLGIIVFYRHRANIGRLFAGTEPRIGGGD